MEIEEKNTVELISEVIQESAETSETKQKFVSKISKKPRVIAIVNQKGGVGKTTTTANLAYVLSKMGKDVLLIDFDSQASLTNYLNVGIKESEEYMGIYEMLQWELQDPEYSVKELLDLTWEEICETCICHPTFKDQKVITTEDGKREAVYVDTPFGFDLAPGHLLLSDYELYIGRRTFGANAFHLTAVIDRILDVHPYDYVLIDCNPSLGVMAINAITAATAGVLIPTNLDLMSTRGVKNLIDKVVAVQEIVLKKSHGRQEHMGVIGVILNLYHERRTVDQTIQKDIERFYPFKIFKNTIPESVNAKKAVFGGLIYSQLYAKAETAYAKLALEIEDQIMSMETEGPAIKYLRETDEEDAVAAENEKVRELIRKKKAEQANHEEVEGQ